MFTSDQIRRSMQLYAVTDQGQLSRHELIEAVHEALKAGVTCVQLREKTGITPDTRALAQSLKTLCAKAGVPFIVNDDIALAQEIDADGVHLGQDDMSCEEARRILGAKKIIGVSVQTIEQARTAQEAGANYVGVGAMFGTPTKTDAIVVSMSELQKICEVLTIPVVVIGGINERTIAHFAPIDIDGVAVVSALFGSQNVGSATKRLLTEVHKIVS